MARAKRPTRSGSPLWRFSLALYRRPGVADACLTLQDRCGADVNLLLFLLWLAASRCRLAPAQLTEIDATVREWRNNVVVPLRRLRRALKHDAPLVAPAVAERFRSRIKTMELKAERLQQEASYALARSLKRGAADTSPDAAARANVAAYQHFLRQAFPPAAVEVLLRAGAEAAGGGAKRTSRPRR